MSDIRLVVITASAEVNDQVLGYRLAVRQEDWDAFAKSGNQGVMTGMARDHLAREVPEGTEIKVDIATEIIEWDERDE